MLRTAVAITLGFALGVWSALLIAGTWNSRTARETELEQQLEQAATKRQEDRTTANKMLAESEQRLAESKKNAESERQRSDQLDKQLQQARKRLERPLSLTMEEAVKAVRREYSASITKMGYDVAGGKVVLAAGYTDMKTLSSVNLLGRMQDGGEFARCFRLIMDTVDPGTAKKPKELSTWFLKSLAFVLNTEASAHRTFGDVTVVVTGAPLPEMPDGVVVRFVPVDAN